jgi:hypothetical protein
MLLFYSKRVSPRLLYIVETFLGDIMDLPIEFTSDKEKFRDHSSARINYSEEKISAEELWVQPRGLLFENNIQKQAITCFNWNGLKAFFKTQGDIPFDIFSAAFYLITRYEEYLPHNLDEYGRYAHTNSIAFQENFLSVPLVNLWRKEFMQLLKAKNEHLPFTTTHFKFVPTYDIDIAYNYLHHSFLKKAAMFSKEFLDGNLRKHRAIFRDGQKDPFDVYDWLDELHEKYQLAPIYFFLLAEKRKGYDKNISPQNKSFQQLIKRHAEKYKTGIHPSWQSEDEDTILKKEIGLLKEISGKEVIESRQHYIRMKLPDTYRLLIANGIREDHSMGYGSINGFRASIASPFYWYDLMKEEQTSLRIHPFCYMDANSFFEQHYNAMEAAEELQQYYDVVRFADGELITIFHNHFLTEQKDWIAWREMYMQFLYDNFDADL